MSECKWFEKTVNLRDLLVAGAAQAIVASSLTLAVNITCYPPSYLSRTPLSRTFQSLNLA